MQKQGVILVALLWLSACGGGGNNASPPITTEPPPPPPPPETTREDIAAASKFAARATFGMTYQEIEALAEEGEDTWLDRQFSLPIGTHTPTTLNLIERRDAGEFADYEEDISYLVQFRRWTWWDCAITCEDQLRQRVAYALSQIFVVSDNVDALLVYPDALTTYYDVLLTHAFGNFRDLLYDVARNPAMGIYLSHLNNNRSNPALNTFPDENFAREVMQLFTIGLFELNQDGSIRLGALDQPISTYDNGDIREFAKVFTGFGFGGNNDQFGSANFDFGQPMRMFDANHEPGAKFLLNDLVLPDGQSGLQDFDAAIDNLFNHPNVGPFIGKQLIQRLVTSNPSPAYIERVASTFNGDATGVRGDMRAVIRAVLTDPEISQSSGGDQNFGKLREPVVRYLSYLRAFGAADAPDFIANGGFFLQAISRQHPLSSPSVFNFYLPSYAPSGQIATAGLVAPEFQITNSSSIVNMTNFIDFLSFGDFVAENVEPFVPLQLNFSEYDALAEDVDAYIERLDLLFAGGALSPAYRQLMGEILNEIADSETRRRLGLYMVLTAADYVIENKEITE